jgi:DNA invertase Pin-like site-specific DNA recombinase
MKKTKLNSKEMSQLVLKVVDDCKNIANTYVKEWKPVNSKWETIEGAVYLRLSDRSQVAVERGSLEQQIHIAIVEAKSRSEREQINYQIIDFYIEAGITGTHDRRPEFQRLQSDIKIGVNKFVIFKEISRLVRDLEIWKRFFNLCQVNDCEICIRGLPFNPNDPASILQLDQLAAFAEFESRTTSKRIKESNHSAMITSGKFNGNYHLLGFDMTLNQFGDNSGIFEPNKKELRQVKLIMEKFLEADRYRIVVDFCNKNNFLTKKGRVFNQASLKAHFINPRYIGKWYRNEKNKERRQDKLMPYDRYTVVELSHGPVIDLKLWERVQEKIKELDSMRAKSVKYIYPLSQILVYEDGTSFFGSGHWGSKSKIFYYYNKKNKIRVNTDIFEKEAKSVLLNIVENSEKFQKSIKSMASQKLSLIDIIGQKRNELAVKLDGLEIKKEKLNKRLSFLLDDDDLEMAKDFKQEYKIKYKKIEEEKIDLLQKIKIMDKELKKLEICEDSSSDSLKLAKKALVKLAKDDRGALKAIYKMLFEKIIVTSKSGAEVELKFILKSVSSRFYCLEDTFRTVRAMVEHARLELATTRL